ncbi:cobalamin biosynthesis protein [Anaerobacillus alkaliphilus]|uniref:Cobalamin biosynthesis protein CobD n=1 Tax=Anaerobacillus alkaliphilus TaxID=1548597 RepID=A0A4Q0VW80_9BACI|nr:adenosylcobinamide-phosphate synthase CbiB [Anaerobacillus alkaliphilus]RXJ03884.1 cobalamin biosynthesis protein [Anaerobacillus alkaliphilus]
MTIETHLIALTLAFMIDLLIGDPKRLPHPVVGMGKLISLFEKTLNKGNHRKGKGIFFLISYLFIIAVVVFAILSICYYIHWGLGLAVEAFIISTTIATKGLKDAALQVYVPLKNNNFELARKNLSMIVGRDTEHLPEGEIVRGTVETVAENTSDGITAPLFYALIGGGVLAVIYRAVNTCDSMVGYKNARYLEYGWASARFDDLLNWLPSRLSAVTMLLANPSVNKKQECFKVLFRDARKHPSPNSGWLEAAMATLLRIELGGRNTYQGVESIRAFMGDPITPLKRDHILRSNTIMLRTCIGFLFILWVLGGIIYAIT